MKTLENEVLNQKNIIIQKITDANGDYRINVYDHVGALQFQKYSKSATWDGNKFDIKFEDSMDVKVDLNDFVEYQLYYTDYALGLETQFSDNIDELRDLQGDIKYQILEEFSGDE